MKTSGRRVGETLGAHEASKNIIPEADDLGRQKKMGNTKEGAIAEQLEEKRGTEWRSTGKTEITLGNNLKGGRPGWKDGDFLEGRFKALGSFGV